MKNEKPVKAEAEKKPVPVAVAAAEQPPVLPDQNVFAPYSMNYRRVMGVDQTETSMLVNLANAHANAVYNGKEGYQLALQNNGYDSRNFGKSEIYVSNSEHYNRWAAETIINNAFSLGVNDGQSSHQSSQVIERTIKKLAKLEKQYDLKDLFDFEKCEAIGVQLLSGGVNPITVSPSYYDPYFSNTNLNYPTSRAVVNELLAEEEVRVIDRLLGQVTQLRYLLDPLRVATKQKELLLSKKLGTKTEAEQLVGLNQQRYNVDYRASQIQIFQIMRGFFSGALPWKILSDNIPEMNDNGNYRTSSSTTQDIYSASKDLRETVILFIKEEASLAKVLEAIIKLNSAVVKYYFKLNDEIGACFAYINRIGMPFEKLVEESNYRFEDLSEEAPW